jgi:hypothetical protein
MVHLKALASLAVIVAPVTVVVINNLHVLNYALPSDTKAM